MEGHNNINRKVYKGWLVGNSMKQINIYIDDKMHQLMLRHKKKADMTWEDILFMGFELMRRELKGGKEDEGNSK